MFGIVVDKQGYKVEFVALNEDKSPQFYELKDGKNIIEDGWQIANSMNKPRWNGSEWVDTEPFPHVEEIPREPTEVEVLTGKISILEEDISKIENINAGLLLENAEHQIKLKEQEITNANLLLEIAMLKGRV